MELFVIARTRITRPWFAFISFASIWNGNNRNNAFKLQINSCSIQAEKNQTKHTESMVDSTKLPYLEKFEFIETSV